LNRAAREGEGILSLLLLWHALCILYRKRRKK